MLAFLGFSKGPKPRTSRFGPKQNWMVVRKLSSQRCGQHFLVQNTQSGEILMRKSVHKDDPSKAQKLRDALSKKLQHTHDNVLRFHDFELDIQSDFCSSSFYFSIFYDYPEMDLETLLTNQIHSRESCSGEHLLKIAYNTMAGLAHLQGMLRNRDSGLLQLDRVYYCAETNNYRVIENINSIRLFDFYFNLTVDQSECSIFAPVCLRKKELIDQKFDLSKIDCFNLGVILLSFGVGEFPAVFYQKNHKNVHWPMIEAKKIIFTEKYKHMNFLCDIVNDLLTPELARRPSLKEVLRKYPDTTKLKDYQDSARSIDVRSAIKFKPQNSLKSEKKQLFPNSGSFADYTLRCGEVE